MHRPRRPTEIPINFFSVISPSSFPSEGQEGLCKIKLKKGIKRIKKKEKRERLKNNPPQNPGGVRGGKKLGLI